MVVESPKESSTNRFLLEHDWWRRQASSFRADEASLRFGMGDAFASGRRNVEGWIRGKSFSEGMVWLT